MVLVCRDCRKRRNGPADIKPKSLLKLVRHAARGSCPKPRVVLTSCLGVCPRGATAVAAVSVDTAPQVICVTSCAELKAALEGGF